MFLRNTMVLLAMLSSIASRPLSAQDDISISGDVTRVEPTSGTIVIRHESNGRLNLGSSTDAFRVGDPIMLNAIRPGAHIRFAADRVNGELVIVKIFTD